MRRLVLYMENDKKRKFILTNKKRHIIVKETNDISI